MAKANKEIVLPTGYISLARSERRPAEHAKLVGPADETERITVTIVLRRRTDGPPLPDFDAFSKMQPGERTKYSREEFSARYGAHPDDVSKVVKFVEKSGLQVIETHLARGTVIVSGTVAQMSRAFAVALNRYQHTIVRYQGRKPIQATETYRGRDGFISVPKGLEDIIVGVFGLDNRTITKRNQADPPNTTTVTVQQVAQLYNFPSNSAAGQNIGIASPTGGLGGYLLSDIQRCLGASMPIITPISAEKDPVTNDPVINGSFEFVTTAQATAGTTVLTFASTTGILVKSSVWTIGLIVPNPQDGVSVTAVTATTVTLNQPISLNYSANIPIGTHIFFNLDGETTQDICIAAAAAPGANIAVFFSKGDQKGWVDLVNRAVVPESGDPVCGVLSSSWYIADGDDLATLANWGVSAAMVDAISQAFQSAAIIGDLTVCIASGDTGSNSKAGKHPIPHTNPVQYGGDGKAHVQYPGSDPWVLSVGGTTIGNIVQTPPSFDEYVWNDPDPNDPSQWGTTGGGVSDYFGLPSYQINAKVPKSVNDNHIGRGVPDVAGNASINSGYSGLFLAGEPTIGNGTSASAPHWAGLIAVINAALGINVGFINPFIYRFGSILFRDINSPPGPKDNSNSGIPGYQAGPGWDACTGWGSPNGKALLGALRWLATAIADSGDFGSVCRGSFVEKELTINNKGLSPLYISNVTSSSPEFTMPSVISYPLDVCPGGSIDLVIRFQPTSFGAKSATLTLLSNDPAGASSVTVSGFVPEPSLNLLIADDGNFGNACVGSFVDEPLTLFNSAPCPLSITKIASSESEFLVPQVLMYPITIAARCSLEVPIRFQPSSFGSKTATITINSDDQTDPHTLAVSGFAPSGKLAVTGSLCFGGVRACCRAERTISICNVGDCYLHVTSVAFKRKNRHWKLINNPFPATLHPGSCLGVVVRYKATEKCPVCCELVIMSDDPITPVKTLDVMAYTIWDECSCKKCCDDCRKGCCTKHHTECCCEGGANDCSQDEEDEDKDMD